MKITTGSTPGVGSWEGRLGEKGWSLFIRLDSLTMTLEFHELTYMELRNKLIEERLVG